MNRENKGETLKRWHIFNLDLAIPEVREKIELYTQALDLFNQGKSFPQVVENLKETGDSRELIEYVVLKAQREDWQNVYKDSKQMLDDSVPFMDIKKELKERDGDDEVVDFICERWYSLKLLEVDASGISDNGIEKGLKGIIIGIIFFILLYQISTKWYVLLLPAFVVVLGVIVILISLVLKFLNIVIHKLNNEPANRFIFKKK